MSHIVALFGYNIDPMKPAKKDIQYFQTNFLNQVREYQGENRRMSYADSGSAKNRPIIFVHGSPGVKDSWYSYLLDKALLKKFHLIAVDRPGYGGSGNGLTEPSLINQASDIWPVLSINDSGLKPILVGHSYGGAVIAKIAMTHSDQIHGIIFVASSVDPKLEKIKFIQRIASLWGIRSIIPKNLRVCNEEILALEAELSKIESDWNSITTKVAVIHGEIDDLVPIENLDFLKSKLNLSKVYLLKDTDHFIPWHQSEVIKSAIQELD